LPRVLFAKCRSPKIKNRRLERPAARFVVALVIGGPPRTCGNATGGRRIERKLLQLKIDRINQICSIIDLGAYILAKLAAALVFTGLL